MGRRPPFVLSFPWNSWLTSCFFIFFFISDNGIIRTLDQPLYVAGVNGNTVYTLDRDSKPREISIDPTEFKFKLALIERRYDQVLNIIRNSNLVGQSVIAYLQKKGYPEIALHFVRDNPTRFDLALECGNLNIALETAQAIDKEPYWNKLANESLRLGNHQVAETALKRIKNFERLSFLYLITGETEKLKKMLKIAEMRGDVMSKFHNALYLGDIDEQLKILKEVGQCTQPFFFFLSFFSHLAFLLLLLSKTDSLAYSLAQTRGYAEEAQLILEANEKEASDAPKLPPGGLLVPPAPILKYSDNWPQLNVSKGMFDSAFPAPAKAAKKEESQPASTLLTETDMEAVGGDWEEDGIDVEGSGAPASAPSGEVGGDWDLEDEDIKLELEKTPEVASGSGNEAYFVPPTQGTSITELWQRNSKLPVDHVLAGSFDSAMRLLNQELGVVNFAPLKDHFLRLASSSRSSLPGVPSLPSLLVPIQIKSEATASVGQPIVPMAVGQLVKDLQAAYQIVTGGKFGEALVQFRNILHASIFVVASSKAELGELQQLVDICQVYLLGLKMEITRKDLKDNETRGAELAAYFTHCNLQPIHLMLTLRSAMNLHYKLENFGSAASFARRLLELGPKDDIAQKARAVQAKADKTPTDKVKLDYSEHNPFEICGETFTPIYRGAPSIKCAFCGTNFHPKSKGIVCAVCDLGEVGLPSNGRTSINLRK